MKSKPVLIKEKNKKKGKEIVYELLKKN